MYGLMVVGVLMVGLACVGWYMMASEAEKFKSGLFAGLLTVTGLFLFAVGTITISFGKPASHKNLPQHQVFVLEGYASESDGKATVLIRFLDGDIEAYEGVSITALPEPIKTPAAVTAERDEQTTTLVLFVPPEAASPADPKKQ